MRSLEAQIQCDIVKWLQSHGFYFFSVPNEAMGRSTVAQMQLVSMGLRRGVADMVVLVPPGVIFLEVKAQDGKQSDHQVKFQTRVEAMGYKYHIVRSVDDVADSLAGFAPASLAP
jgi:hypothetical protein